MPQDSPLIQQLRDHGLRITTNRKEVLSVFQEHAEVALSSADIEDCTNASLDRITLYRTLKTFEKAGLIHKAVDPSGRIKYALCSTNGCEHEHQDNHAHFHCTACDKTTCLEGVVVPTITVPAAYQVEQTQLVLSGICGECS
ncbi:MAG: transcriptional repressor [Bacteroidota bacterium]